ncbi:MAG: 16S rRNA (cytosine(1402)-N(4))-methyltransferase RsmH, partial [Planctomycetes bacterium]|nr:16S rRNA (cytosine(1402)-N(4))-methyltransferase RsmH [Planctomycetota bacterium]
SNLGPEGVIVGLDVDKNAVQRAHLKLDNLACKVILINSNFSQIAEQLLEQNIKKVDFILADLGVSSQQLADSEKGLSFQVDMPLDMRMDAQLETTAAEIISRTNENDLADLIFEFGEERASRRIARFIVENRKIKPIETTGELAAIVCRALKRPGKKQQRNRIHPATRTFQALRIAVNDELGSLRELLTVAPLILKENGRIAIISFHSLEDRIVKYDFKEKAKDGFYKIITKKPIVPTKEEIAENRRARSAKLRIAQRVMSS